MAKVISRLRLKLFARECGGLVQAAQRLGVHPFTLTRIFRRQSISGQLREKIKNNLAHLSGTSSVRAGFYRQSESRSQQEAISQTMHKEPDLIFIPQDVRGQPIAGIPMSARLAHVLQNKGIRLLGELHGLSFSGMASWRNCGSKTLQELRAIVRTVQLGEQLTSRTPTRTLATQCVEAGCFSVPPDGQELNPFELPISGRLERTLHAKGITRLGELDGVSFSELRKVEGCGKKVIEELVRLLDRTGAGEFRPTGRPFRTSETSDLLRLVESILSKMQLRSYDILLLRFGAADNQALTLEEIGSRFKLTRERVRQIVGKGLLAMRREGGPGLGDQLRGVAAKCRELVCPLTPSLLSHWLGGSQSQFRFCTGFYVRLLTELDRGIPGWAKGQEPSPNQNSRDNAILRELETVLENYGPMLPLKESFEIACQSANVRGLQVNEFLDAVKHSKMVVVQFTQPDRPEIALRYVRASAVARLVLQDSDQPLTPEEILSRGQTKFGSELVDWDSRSFANMLTPDKGFYLLGPRAYGLRRHFRLQQSMRCKVRADVRKLLSKENRPISTTEIVNDRKFPWTEDMNAYELAQVLREDQEFIDLGRFLFALAAWGIEEREYAKDLIPKVLEEVGQPITATQALERLQRLRSVSPGLISVMLRKHPLVRNLGFGYYGLRSWGDTIKDGIVANAVLLERVIRRSEPPLSFSRLCQILDVRDDCGLADKLWQTCSSLPSIIRSSNERMPNTLLLHRSCSLERALVATARAVSRPLPVYEFQWELNARFGPLFGQKSNAEISRCLQHSRLFLRNADGEFILDIHLDQLGLDEEAIRQACFEILSESKEIVGCDDLIERMEAEGKVWEELSPDILGSLMREDGAFEEVGHNRFRAKPCER